RVERRPRLDAERVASRVADGPEAEREAVILSGRVGHGRSSIAMTPKRVGSRGRLVTSIRFISGAKARLSGARLQAKTQPMKHLFIVALVALHVAAQGCAGSTGKPQASQEARSPVVLHDDLGSL